MVSEEESVFVTEEKYILNILRKHPRSRRTVVQYMKFLIKHHTSIAIPLAVLE